MPRVDNPNAIANTLPGQLARVKAITDDIKSASANALYNLVVGLGGAVINGTSQFVGAVIGPLNVAGSVSATTTIAAGGALSGASLGVGSGAIAGGAISGASVAVTGAATSATVTTSGDITSNGNLNTPGTLTAATAINCLGAYSNLLTSGYRGLWVTTTGSTGAFGYVPSSRRFKQDEKPAVVNLTAALAMQVVNFRYKQAVIDHGDQAAVEWGVIAEDLHALGFTWLVDYDEAGLPFGVKTEKIIFAFIPVIQDHEARLRKAGL